MGDEYRPEEVAQRSDEVLRRMIATPPQPRATPDSKSQKKAVLDQKVRARETTE